ncbi:MAG TPA: glycosyltransferase family A protein [Sphingomicrobium sp.]|nr:glycosyltransferase family A protein [Sphingomicrobium sp.]
MASPSISVIIPAFNRAHLVGYAIDSVLAQRFTDFELIVVDDGSTDATASLVRKYDDPRIRLVEQDNRGSNAARNAGIRAAKAPLLTFLDSDDLYLSGKLDHVVRAFAERQEMDVLVDSFLKLTSPHARRRFIEMRNPVTDCTRDFAKALFQRNLWKATSAISVRKSAVERAGLFTEDIKQRQDFDLLIRLTETADCRSTDEILWIKTWTADRITSRGRFIAATLELVRRHPQYYSNTEYRAGLARDLINNAALLLRERNGRQVMADLRLVARELGTLRTGLLAAQGLRQALLRGLRRRRDARPKPVSTEARQALEAARNRASLRS